MQIATQLLYITIQIVHAVNMLKKNDGQDAAAAGTLSAVFRLPLCEMTWTINPR